MAAIVDLAVSEQLIELEVQELKQRALHEVEERLAGREDVDANTVSEFTILRMNDGKRVVLYSTKDGTTSLVNALHITEPMKRRHPDGTKVFSTKPVNPDWKYAPDAKTGQPQLVRANAMLCYLHPEHPDRDRLNLIGLDALTCRKSNIANEYQRVKHMESKHLSAWRAIQDNKAALERQEQLDVMRAQMQAMQALAAGQKRGA